MKHYRWIACALVSLLLLAPVAPALAQGEGEYKDIRPDREPQPQGQGFCFQRNLVFGNIVITGGRCYTFYILRMSTGTFLGFGPPNQVLIPPGQLVRLHTPAGAKVKGRLFYLVPLQVQVIRIPMNSIQFVAVQVSTQANHVIIKVPNVSDRLVEAAFLQR